jgi:hypothetical protein
MKGGTGQIDVPVSHPGGAQSVALVAVTSPAILAIDGVSRVIHEKRAPLSPAAL